MIIKFSATKVISICFRVWIENNFIFLELNDVNNIVHNTYEFKSKNAQREFPNQNLNAKHQYHASTIDHISEDEDIRNKNKIISVEKNSILQKNSKKVEEEAITSKEFFLNNLTEKSRRQILGNIFWNY
jgi:hypothetical protein